MLGNFLIPSHWQEKNKHPSKQSTSADVSLTSVQRQFNVELTLDWRKTDICQRRLFTGIVDVLLKVAEYHNEEVLENPKW